MPRTPVFVSWSGPVAQPVASLLCWWLKKVVPVEPWHSPDVEAGDAWFTTVMERLTSSSIGIVVVTPDNYRNPWLLFEAGAIARSFGQPKVITYFSGLKPTDIDGPLTKFQGKHADRLGTFDVVKTINRALPADERHGEQDLLESFDQWWPRLEEKLAALPQHPDEKAAPTRKVPEMVEEVLTILRRMEAGARETDLGNRARAAVIREIDDLNRRAAEARGGDLPLRRGSVRCALSVDGVEVWRGYADDPTDAVRRARESGVDIAEGERVVCSGFGLAGVESFFSTGRRGAPNGG